MSIPGEVERGTSLVLDDDDDDDDDDEVVVVALVVVGSVASLLLWYVGFESACNDDGNGGAGGGDMGDDEDDDDDDDSDGNEERCSSCRSCSMYSLSNSSSSFISHPCRWKALAGPLLPLLLLFPVTEPALLLYCCASARGQYNRPMTTKSNGSMAMMAMLLPSRLCRRFLLLGGPDILPPVDRVTSTL